MHNAILLSRQRKSLKMGSGITRSTCRTRMGRYLQGPSTRPPGRKMKPFKDTCKKTSQQGTFDTLASLLLLLLSLYIRKILQLICRLGRNPQQPQQVPTQMLDRRPYTSLHIYIYALHVLSQIFKLLGKSYCIGRYTDLLRYYIFLAPLHILSQA